MRTRGMSYFLSTILFPEPLQSQVMTLYAFVRYPDDVVDNPLVDDHSAHQQLVQYRQQLHDAWSGSPVENQIITDRVAIAQSKDIPLQWMDDFLDAMIADTQKKFYQTYHEVQHYMYGSAEVVGLMMTKLIGYDHHHETKVLRGARLLGEAMQYTNFLRDVSEDRLQHGRIYMPERELQKHHISHAMLKNYTTDDKPVTTEWKKFMASQIAHTRELYRQAEEIIDLLYPDGRSAVLMASRMYQAILDRIYRNEYDVFISRTRTSMRHKLAV